MWLRFEYYRRWLAAGVLLAISASVQAADTAVLSQQTYQVLESTQQWLEAGEHARAVTRLEQLVTETAKQPYEQAIALQSLAHAHLAAEDYAAAIPHLKRSLALGVLPQEAQQRGRYNLAQLYLATERFSEAIELLEEWFKYSEAPQAQAYVMLGSAHLQLKHYRQAIEPLRKAIALSEEPKESWHQSLLGAYSELQDYAQCVTLLHTMLKLFPERPAYWRQLAGIELLRERYAEALAVMELAYLRGYLETERDLLNLAQLYSHHNAPYKAARLIETELHSGHLAPQWQTWEQAANAWYQAREMDRTITALEQAAGSGGGIDLGLRLAQLYLEAHRWEEADNMLQRVLSDQQITEEQAGRAWLLLGIARYEGKLSSSAAAAFSEAMKFSSTRSEARQWLAYLQRQE